MSGVWSTIGANGHLDVRPVPKAKRSTARDLVWALLYTRGYKNEPLDSSIRRIHAISQNTPERPYHTNDKYNTRTTALWRYAGERDTQSVCRRDGAAARLLYDHDHLFFLPSPREPLDSASERLRYADSSHRSGDPDSSPPRPPVRNPIAFRGPVLLDSSRTHATNDCHSNSDGPSFCRKFTPLCFHLCAVNRFPIGCPRSRGP